MAAHGPHGRKPESNRPRKNVSSHSAGVRANTNQSSHSGTGLAARDGDELDCQGRVNRHPKGFRLTRRRQHAVGNADGDGVCRMDERQCRRPRKFSADRVKVRVRRRAGIETEREGLTGIGVRRGVRKNQRSERVNRLIGNWRER